MIETMPQNSVHISRCSANSSFEMGVLKSKQCATSWFRNSLYLRVYFFGKLAHSISNERDTSQDLRFIRMRRKSYEIGINHITCVKILGFMLGEKSISSCI